MVLKEAHYLYIWMNGMEILLSHIGSIYDGENLKKHQLVKAKNKKGAQLCWTFS